MHSQQPPGVVQNWSTLQCSKQNTEQCGYDHAPVTRGRMRAQFPLPHGPPGEPPSPVAPLGMPCTQCARSAKFWMSANTRTLVLAPFHKFLVPYQGFFGFPSI